ncbi:exodeoxyribonuclease V subunit gamma [Nocardioides sp.]|uniref:exodeoxyribonuclease V subunit gamma n=1 Tax=Nocardioides sp. TaxID=35761 RepID=UPI0035150B8C
MALHLHRAPRTDLLADALAALLAEPVGDPLAPEVVVVPARGVERWLTQRLSHRLGVGVRGGDGVCAGLDLLTPHALVSLLLGRDAEDPWEPDRLVWPLLDTLDAVTAGGEPWARPLAVHLGHGPVARPGDDARRDRRWAVARRLAGHLASVAVQRPDLATHWREGGDGDARGGPLPPDLAWQPPLWRALVARMTGVTDVPSPDLRLTHAVESLRTGEVPGALPSRLSLFGHTRLGVGDVRLLDALGGHRDVHLWLPQPSGALWEALTAAARTDPTLRGVVPRRLDTSAAHVGHPLLASLGRDARELHRLLDVPHLDHPIQAPDQEAPRTLLGWLQHDLRANAAPGSQERAARVLHDADRTVQVHACHGAARQVEVLREVLLGLLDDDPTLEPRDVLVMCPDIEAYAPLFAAAFGLAPETEGGEPAGAPGHPRHPVHPGHRLRVRLADRSPAGTNPLLALAARLLETTHGRATASDVLDLAGQPVVRRRFEFDDDDLERLARWVADAGVRWGLDAEHRTRFAMGGFAQGTWRAGLDRILLGVALSGDDLAHVGRGLPLDDIGTSEVDLVGRVAELLDRLDAAARGFEAARTAADWTTTLADAVRGLAEPPAEDAWQLAQLERELARIAATAGPQAQLRHSDVRSLLRQQLIGRPTRASFRTGTLTVCTMVPMRSVPHRVVALVGLDDGVFPRASVVHGDDALARDPLTGERDPRSEDRQLLLDAILATREHLVLTYAGAGEQTGAPRPPAVPLGELLDTLDRTAAAPVRDRVLRRHPLQAHDPRNFVDPVPFSFDRAALEGARASVAERRPVPPLVDAPLPPAPPADVSVAELVAFVVAPVRAFLRERLGVGTSFDADEPLDGLPVELDSLAAWAVGDRLLREALAGADPRAVVAAEHLRGTLPPGELGRRDLDRVAGKVRQLLDRTAELRVPAARSIDVDVDLGDGRRVVGTVPGVHGARIVSLGYSRLKPKQRLTSWVHLLAVSAARPDEHWTAHAVGWERAGPRRALAGPLDHRALGWLRDLVDLREEGLQRPLPLPVATAAAWAEGLQRAERGDDVTPAELARRAWTTERRPDAIPGEDAEAAHVRCFGEAAPLEVLLDAGLPDLARRLWTPLLGGIDPGLAELEDAQRLAPLEQVAPL